MHQRHGAVVRSKHRLERGSSIPQWPEEYLREVVTPVANRNSRDHWRNFCGQRWSISSNRFRNCPKGQVSERGEPR
jgi:hypothetical protein